ncbi:unnamed protein product, partial [Closterium sp. NIES-53]
VLGMLMGFILCVLLILLFVEIAPPAICARHSLRIASATAWLARLLLLLLSPVAYPVSLLLDRYLNNQEDEEESILRRGLLCGGSSCADPYCMKHGGSAGSSPRIYITNPLANPPSLEFPDTTASALDTGSAAPAAPPAASAGAAAAGGAAGAAAVAVGTAAAAAAAAAAAGGAASGAAAAGAQPSSASFSSREAGGGVGETGEQTEERDEEEEEEESAALYSEDMDSNTRMHMAGFGSMPPRSVPPCPPGQFLRATQIKFSLPSKSLLPGFLSQSSGAATLPTLPVLIFLPLQPFPSPSPLPFSLLSILPSLPDLASTTQVAPSLSAQYDSSRSEPVSGGSDSPLRRRIEQAADRAAAAGAAGGAAGTSTPAAASTAAVGSSLTSTPFLTPSLPPVRPLFPFPLLPPPLPSQQAADRAAAAAGAGAVPSTPAGGGESGRKTESGVVGESGEEEVMALPLGESQEYTSVEVGEEGEGYSTREEESSEKVGRGGRIGRGGSGRGGGEETAEESDEVPMALPTSSDDVDTESDDQRRNVGRRRNAGRVSQMIRGGTLDG